MTSLTQQMEQLQQQQEILAHKIKEEKKREREREENPLGVLNNYIVQDLERLSWYMKQIGWREIKIVTMGIFVIHNQDLKLSLKYLKNKMLVLLNWKKCFSISDIKMFLNSSRDHLSLCFFHILVGTIV